MKSFTNATPYKYFLGDQTKNGNLRMACGTWGGEEKCKQGFDGKLKGQTLGEMSLKETGWEDL